MLISPKWTSNLATGVHINSNSRDRTP